MDSKLFRLPTSPNFYGAPHSSRPVDIRTTAVNQNIPAPDSRFPGWPAPMADARLVTNYQPHCQSNIPAGRQYPSVRWMQRNGDKIIETNRAVAGKQMGGIYGLDDTVVPPPSNIIKCSRSACSISNTEARGGIGLERRDIVPELVGTYELDKGPSPPSNTEITRKYEGGRNSLRGALIRS